MGPRQPQKQQRRAAAVAAAPCAVPEQARSFESLPAAYTQWRAPGTARALVSRISLVRLLGVCGRSSAPCAEVGPPRLPCWGWPGHQGPGRHGAGSRPRLPSRPSPIGSASGRAWAASPASRVRNPPTSPRGRGPALTRAACRIARAPRVSRAASWHAGAGPGWSRLL